MPREPSLFSSVPSATPLRLTFGYATDRGKVRDLDEDALVAIVFSSARESVQKTVGLFAVADGMGGHEGGEIASKLVIHSITDNLINNLFLPLLTEEGVVFSDKAVISELKKAIEAANSKVSEVAHKTGNEGMGSTLTLACIIDDTAYVANVGDSRTYLLGKAGLERITVDHSLVEILVSQGKLKLEEVFTHPQRNVVTRVVGLSPMDVDIYTRKLEPGDYLLLCCDGLWEMLRNPQELQGIISEAPNPQVACDELLRKANEYGGEDNISAIVVKLE